MHDIVTATVEVHTIETKTFCFLYLYVYNVSRLQPGQTTPMEHPTFGGSDETMATVRHELQLKAQPCSFQKPTRSSRKGDQSGAINTKMVQVGKDQEKAQSEKRFPL